MCRSTQQSFLRLASTSTILDAYLAAFAMAGGTDFVTLDHDFKNLLTHGLDLTLLNP
jgi:uncharacterized protein